MSELITIKQLPIIEEQLATIGAEIDARTAEALSLAVTEDTVKDVKKIRAELNKEYEELEAQRKAVKKAITEPYARFEEIYKAHVSSKYTAADNTLKERVSEVESEVLKRRIDELAAYSAELLEVNGIDFCTPALTLPHVTLSSSMPQAKKHVKEYVERLAADRTAIYALENAVEIMSEYIHNHDFAKSLTIVEERKRRVEEEKARKEAAEQQRKEQEIIVEKVESALPPPEVVEPVKEEPVTTVQFSVTTTVAKLKELKQFLIDGGYDFE